MTEKPSEPSYQQTVSPGRGGGAYAVQGGEQHIVHNDFRSWGKWIALVAGLVVVLVAGVPAVKDYYSAWHADIDLSYALPAELKLTAGDQQEIQLGKHRPRSYLRLAITLRDTSSNGDCVIPSRIELKPFWDELSKPAQTFRHGETAEVDLRGLSGAIVLKIRLLHPDDQCSAVFKMPQAILHN